MNNIGKPLWLLAELTHACPLQCAYCSNPLELVKRKEELNTEEWKGVIAAAREMGAVQLGFSGGEPLIRPDLEALINYAHHLGFYTNLITSGAGLNVERAKALKKAGLDNIQISFQAGSEDLNNALAKATVFRHKLEMAQAVKSQGFSLILNFVLHRYNIDSICDILKLALDLSADYIELANTQYYGFALHNRDKLLPTKAQVENAEVIAHEFQQKYADRMKIYYILPDYYQDRPKACMSGWGNIFLTITPDGLALPCHSARVIPDLDFPSVREHSLDWIWKESPLFNRFRGFNWMSEPCQSCPEKHKDFGGCRCQAYLITGDAGATDPVCHLSKNHHKINKAILEANDRVVTLDKLTWRNRKNARLVRS